MLLLSFSATTSSCHSFMSPNTCIATCMRGKDERLWYLHKLQNTKTDRQNKSHLMNITCIPELPSYVPLFSKLPNLQRWFFICWLHAKLTGYFLPPDGRWTVWQQLSLLTHGQTVPLAVICRDTGFTDCFVPCGPCRLVCPQWLLEWRCPLSERWPPVRRATCPPATEPCGFETMASSPRMYILRDWDTQETQKGKIKQEFKLSLGTELKKTNGSY